MHCKQFLCKLVECQRFSESRLFNDGIAAVIVAAGVIVGLQTDEVGVAESVPASVCVSKQYHQFSHVERSVLPICSHIPRVITWYFHQHITHNAYGIT